MNGYDMFTKLHPAGELYRYFRVTPREDGWDPGWKDGKVYYLIRWERPEGLDKRTPIRNAVFLVNGEEKRMDISFFAFLEKVE
jgi:hypothetical protein